MFLGFDRFSADQWTNFPFYAALFYDRIGPFYVRKLPAIIWKLHRKHLKAAICFDKVSFEPIWDTANIFAKFRGHSSNYWSHIAEHLKPHSCILLGIFFASSIRDQRDQLA